MTASDSHMDVHGDVIDKLTVPEAAKLLGVTQSAIHKRIARELIRWEKDEEGRVYVFLDPAEIVRERVNDRSTDTSKDELITSLRDQIAAYKDQVDYLRAELSRRAEAHSEELRRKDTIMTMASRIPELEPASESRESPTEAAGGSEGVEEEAPLEGKQRSWWRRLIG